MSHVSFGIHHFDLALRIIGDASEAHGRLGLNTSQIGLDTTPKVFLVFA